MFLLLLHQPKLSEAPGHASRLGFSKAEDVKVSGTGARTFGIYGHDDIAYTQAVIRSDQVSSCKDAPPLAGSEENSTPKRVISGDQSAHVRGPSASYKGLSPVGWLFLHQQPMQIMLEPSMSNQSWRVAAREDGRGGGLEQGRWA